MKINIILLLTCCCFSLTISAQEDSRKDNTDISNRVLVKYSDTNTKYVTGKKLEQFKRNLSERRIGDKTQTKYITGEKLENFKKKLLEKRVGDKTQTKYITDESLNVIKQKIIAKK